MSQPFSTKLHEPMAIGVEMNFLSIFLEANGELKWCNLKISNENHLVSTQRCLELLYI